MIDLEFYKGKRVLITGHTGFKGTWLCKILINLGAIVSGYSIGINTDPSLFKLSEIENKMKSIYGDIRNIEALKKAFDETEPEIVFHMAAQPLVLEGYRNPVYTYDTNVMGTVNVLECIRKSKTVKSFINVTTDKVYKNNKNEEGYKEEDLINGSDPYSNSKSCSELITSCYKNSFFSDNSVRISTVRAANVIGGGDFSANRIIPDCIRAALDNKIIEIRNPKAIRQFQHVLEPLFAYLLIAEKQFKDEKYSGSYNIGPRNSDCITIEKLSTIFCAKWGENLRILTNNERTKPYEIEKQIIDSSKIKKELGWKSCWNIEQAVEKTVEFTKVYRNGGNISEYMDEQINEYIDFIKD